MTTSPRYSERRRFSPVALFSAKSGAGFPTRATDADTAVAASASTNPRRTRFDPFIAVPHRQPTARPAPPAGAAHGRPSPTGGWAKAPTPPARTAGHARGALAGAARATSHSTSDGDSSARREP